MLRLILRLIGHSTGMARRIEAATGIETRATILGYMQRGGSPTCKGTYDYCSYYNRFSYGYSFSYSCSDKFEKGKG